MTMCDFYLIWISLGFLYTSYLAFYAKTTEESKSTDVEEFFVSDPSVKRFLTNMIPRSFSDLVYGIITIHIWLWIFIFLNTRKAK